MNEEDVSKKTSKKRKFTAGFTVRLPPSYLAELEALAEHHNLRKVTYARKVILDHLETYFTKKPLHERKKQ